MAGYAILGPLEVRLDGALVMAGAASAAAASAPAASDVRVAAAAAPAHSALAAALDGVAHQGSVMSPRMNHNRL